MVHDVGDLLEVFQQAQEILLDLDIIEAAIKEKEEQEIEVPEWERKIAASKRMHYDGLQALAKEINPFRQQYN